MKNIKVIAALFAKFAGGCGRFLWLHLRRTFAWNLRQLPLSPRESAVLQRNGVEDATLSRFLAWRRSVFLVAGVANVVIALLYTANTLDVYLDTPKLWSGLGILSLAIRNLALFAIPAAVLAANLTWSRPRLSRTLLMAGWIVSWTVPVALALVPSHLLFDLKSFAQWRQEPPMRAIFDRLSFPTEPGRVDGWLDVSLAKAIDLLGAAVHGFLLLPLVLSLFPGVLRACIRLKVLLPESIVPGWFLVVTVPLYIFCWLLAFLVLRFILIDGRLLTSYLLLMAGPLAYLIAAASFIRPLTSGEIRHLRWIQIAYSVMTVVAIGLSLHFLFTAELTIGEQRHALVGWDEETSLIPALEVVSGLGELVLDYLGRSLFTTAVVADLFMALNLSVWRNQHRFRATPAAEQYDKLMDEWDHAGRIAPPIR